MLDSFARAHMTAPSAHERGGISAWKGGQVSLGGRQPRHINPIQVRYQTALRPDQNRYYHRGVRRINSPPLGANRTSPALNDLGNSDPMISGRKLACC